MNEDKPVVAAARPACGHCGRTVGRVVYQVKDADRTSYYCAECFLLLHTEHRDELAKA